MQETQGARPATDNPANPATGAQPAPADRKSAARPAGLGYFKGWVRDLMLSVSIAGFIILFLYQPVKVEGSSMQPMLEDQERIFINKFVYRLEPINRGDIVVFRYPRDLSKSYIKRVIAVSGDRVRIESGLLYVNDVPVREDYIPPAYWDFRSYPEIIVPQGAYFVMGDHRSMSNDSREFGPVNERYIFGKAVFIYWPMNKLGVLH